MLTVCLLNEQMDYVSFSKSPLHAGDMTRGTGWRQLMKDSEFQVKKFELHSASNRQFSKILSKGREDKNERNKQAKQKITAWEKDRNSGNKEKKVREYSQ